VAFLIDTSALIHVLRDKSGKIGHRYDAIVGAEPVKLSRVTSFELLKGARDDAEWSRLEHMLSSQAVLEVDGDDWMRAARIVFDLRRKGSTLKAPIDALIAQVAMRHSLTLLHDDHDFELIAAAYPLKLLRFSLQDI
jgi:predicted nucleic acid-binding protein